MRLIKIIITILFLFLFSGCSQKVVIQKELICFNQEILQPLEEVVIRIYKDDLEVAKEFKNIIDNRFLFYENQVLRNNELCKKEDKK